MQRGEEGMQKDIIYMDNAATTFPKPERMHDTMSHFYRTYGVNPGRTGCDLALEAEEMIHATRKKFSAFFNNSFMEAGGKKDPNRLVFTSNATDSLNLILKGTVGPGDHVVTTMVEHNSVIRPVNHLVRLGAEATFVKPDVEGYVDPEDIRKAIRKNTTLVIVNHGSNVIGVVQDIRAIGKICHENNIPFAVDSAQTAGVIPIDMKECHIDFLAFTGHKGLFGPTGIGGICVADDAEIRGTIWGGTGVRSAVPYHLEEYPYRLEAGTLNLAGIAGLSAGLDWILEQGLEKIYRHEMDLLEMLQDGFSSIRGVTISGTARIDKRVATMSAKVGGYDAGDVGTILDVEYNILTRTGLHCAPLIHEHLGTTPRGTVRFSMGPYNTKDHVEAAIRAMEEVASDRN